jgi:Na+-driven multidrug efflux pump
MTRIIGMAMILSTVVNIILDPGFIFLLDMGVVGAGLATSVSIAIAALFMLVSSIRSKTSIPIRFNISRARLVLVKEILTIGFPQFLSMATISIGIMVLNNLVGNIGELYMNAWTIVGRLDQILLIPGMAVATSTVTMISQNFGRNNLDRVQSIYKHNVALVSIMVAVATIVYVAVVPVFFPVFSSVKEVVDAAVLQVRLTAITYVGIGIAFTSVSAFQSTGKAFPAVAMPIFRLGLITVPLAFLLVYVYDLQMMGVYLACIMGNLCIAPFSFFWTSRHLKRVTFRAVDG